MSAEFPLTEAPREEPAIILSQFQIDLVSAF
jgi:hypothetical protein